MIENFQIQRRYIKRTNRLSIKLLPNRVLLVTSPYGFPEEEIQQLILKKQDWILKKYQLLEAQPKPKVLKFTSGEELTFLGEVLTLKLIAGFEKGVVRNENILYAPTEKTKKLVLEWFQQQALKKIQERVEHYSQKLGVKAKSVSIKNYKARWGACSSKGNLILNWQIITFKPEILDYVVAHEICHLKEMNHSARFYQHLKFLGFERKKYHAQMRQLTNFFI